MNTDRTRRAHDYMIEIGRLVVNFTGVARAPRYPDGHRETDVEHSFHLALSATELAADFYPQFDQGLITQFSLVHDLPEVYAGDVWTFMISDEDKKKKEANEAKATKKLLKELPPHLAQLLKRYEEQTEPEARFVRLVDKLLPAVINMMSGDAGTFVKDYKLDSIDQLITARQGHVARFQEMFPEFDVIHLVHDMIADTSTNHIISRLPKDKR